MSYMYIMARRMSILVIWETIVLVTRANLMLLFCSPVISMSSIHVI